MALIGIINAAPSLLTVHTTTCLSLLHSRSPSEELLKIKRYCAKKEILPWQILSLQPFIKKCKLVFIHPSPPSICVSCSLLHSFPGYFSRERKGETERAQKTRGKKARLSSVNWSECTTKSGFTTKVSRSDCQYCQRNGVLGRGGSKGGGDTKVRWWGRQEGLLWEKEILWYFGMLEGWMWRTGGWGSNYRAIIGG